ncbi:MAG TPA: hypothetical protein VFW33_09535, partial [Gemmataceae bacterium]|nr:hypothetical protein [Gemmataceae bacterium]
MSTAKCPCCGSKEPVPAGAAGRRLICTNCGTPFVPAAEPPAAERVEAEPVVEAELNVEPLPPEPAPPPKKRKKSAAPPRRRSESETVDEVETVTDVPRRDRDEGDGRPVPPRSRPRRGKKSGGAVALVLGAGAFGAMLLCGGLGVAGYLYFRPYLGGSVAETTGKEAATEKQSAPEGTELVEAGKSVRLGDVRVGVGPAVIDVVAGTEAGVPFHSADKLLSVKVRLDNLSDSRKVEYAGWGADSGGDDLPRLTDEQGRACKLVTFGGERRVTGQLRSETIAPKKGVSDVIVFDPPADDARVLKLELPGHNVGATGRVGFKIPRSMIRFGALPTEEDRTRSVPELIAGLKDSDPAFRAA